MEADPDGSLATPAKWITTNDAGYVIVFRPPGQSFRLVGNWHKQTEGWEIDSITPPGIDHKFELKLHGYFLHPQTGSTRHGRIDRHVQIDNGGSVSEQLKITWLTDGNQLHAIYVGQNTVRDGVQSIQFEDGTVVPEDGVNHDAAGGNSVTWSTESNWVLKIQTNADETRFGRTGKVYPRLFDAEVKNAGDTHDVKWAWFFSKI